MNAKKVLSLTGMAICAVIGTILEDMIRQKEIDHAVKEQLAEQNKEETEE